MKRIIISIAIILFVFVGVTVASSFLIINGGKILKNFSLISVDNIANKYFVKFEPVKAASYYEVIVYNSNNVIFFREETNETELEIDFEGIKYDETYKLVIYAYDEVNDSIAINNPYSFKYSEPTFSKENKLVLDNDEDYHLQIDGNLIRKSYQLVIKDEGKILVAEKLSENKFIISHDFYKDQEIKLNIEIYDGKNIIDTFSLYNQINPVEPVIITSPNNDAILDYNDVIFTYEGGKNATQFKIQIHRGEYLIAEKNINKNRSVISSAFFTKGTKYTIKVLAQYEDYENYKNAASIDFTMNEKDTLKPVYINKYYKYVRSGSNIILNNPNEGGDIYYTLDGADPETDGILYDEPIFITKNTIIKTVIKEENKNNSVISTFPINVGTKKQYVVYLSPSNQYKNLGVSSVGYTNERAEMNDLSNYIEKKLIDAGIKVVRNNPLGNINLWNSQSKYYGADLHLVVHSNGSTKHDKYGIETWINEQTSQTFSLANLIQNNLMSIYYLESNDGNRGIKYANGSLGEVNELYVPFGILLEIGHHDYKEDALWIMNNKKLIGETVANTIITYFG